MHNTNHINLIRPHTVSAQKKLCLVGWWVGARLRLSVRCRVCWLLAVTVPVGVRATPLT